MNNPNVKMMPGKIAVAKLGKSNARNNGAFVVPNTVDSLGEIKYISSEQVGDLQVGMKVYFGDKRQQVRMAGEDLEVMHLENIIAIVEG